MRLSQNEIKIITMIRQAQHFSKISITKKASKDKVEYKVEVISSEFLTRDIDNIPDNLL